MAAEDFNGQYRHDLTEEEGRGAGEESMRVKLTLRSCFSALVQLAAVTWFDGQPCDATYVASRSHRAQCYLGGGAGHFSGVKGMIAAF